MGYFATEEDKAAYQSEWCATCGHQIAEGCPVWLAHGIGHESQASDPVMEAALQVLIPRRGVSNLKCRMHVDTKS
jgi:hypothetical protein